jgi:hypothetical protein
MNMKDEVVAIKRRRILEISCGMPIATNNVLWT